MYSKLRIDGIGGGHVQGIAIDRERRFFYYSFTTCLIKTDMDGNVVGSVTGLVGHLGCIAYNDADGKVYGSLEYKHDAIGKGILKRLNSNADFTDGFYVAIFDVDKIDRPDMDACGDGVMRAVFLSEVTEDYEAEGKRYGCSGIDGLTFAPIPGVCDGKKQLYVAYGIYGDVSRTDNDHQVILRYDVNGWDKLCLPLDQRQMHRSGPSRPDEKYFVYTGNTNYGIQNLEYDAYTHCMLAAVYRGRKECFPNFPMYAIDMKKPAKEAPLEGLNEIGMTLSLADIGCIDEKTGIRGIEFPYGATGMISLGDGSYLFSHDFSRDGTWGTVVKEYRFNGKNEFTEINSQGAKNV